MKKLTFLFCLTALFVHQVFSQTVIHDSTEVFGTWTKANSPYLIEGEAIVPEDSTLVIEPGVIVKLKTGTNFDYTSDELDAGFIIVNGKLICEGIKTDSIKFTRYGDEGFWGSVIFLNQSDTIDVDYCIFEYGNKVLNSVPDGYFKTSYGAATFYRSNLIIEHCVFRNNNDRGFYIIRESNCIIKNNKCYNNYYGGEIYLGSFGTDSTYNNVFNNNYAGIRISSTGSLFENEFFNNTHAGILTLYKTKILRNEIYENEHGIYGKPAWGNQVINNKIYNNNFGVYFLDEGFTYLINNLIVNNNHGILLNGLGANKIYNNTIANNKESGLNHYRCYGTALKNNIHWNNKSEFIFSTGFEVQNCFVQDSVLAEGLIDLGENILGGDPLFADTLTSDFSLLPNSVCINSGTIDTTGLMLPSLGIYDNPRISSGRIDMGAFEYQDNSGFVRIQKPYYHEYLVSNLYYDLKWNLSDSLASVKLIFSPDKGATWQDISSITENDGAYTWKIPELSADSCLWAVVDLANPGIADTSTYCFTVSPNIIPDGCNYYGTFKEEFSPYQILGKMLVPEDSVLFIDPGTIIKLKDGTDFEEDDRFDDEANVGVIFIYGKLIAEGEENNPVHFTRIGNTGNWGTIFFDQSASNNSILNNCIVEHAYKYQTNKGNTVFKNEGAINIYSDSVQIKNSIFRNSNKGVYLGHTSNGTKINNCLIVNNDVSGIDGYYGEIHNCTISENGGTGISGVFDIKNCIVYNNNNSIDNPFNNNNFDKAKIAYSLIEENVMPAYYIDSGGLLMGLPPQFIDPVAEEYHLYPNSPCIDSGDPTDDFSNEPEPNGGRINMGAYGNTTEAASFQPLPRIDQLSVYESSILGNDTLTITGKYFLETRGSGRVFIDNNETYDYLKWNDSTIICIIPAHPSGLYDISVTNRIDSTGVKKSVFTYVEPDIHKVDAQFGTVLGGKQIEISGSNFGEKQFNTSLFFGDELVLQISSWTDSLINVVTPANTEGYTDIIFSSYTIQDTTRNAFLYTDKDVINVCGQVAGTWMANKIYVLDCDIEVPEDSSLLIEPGVTVIAGIQESPLRITVNGMLEVGGSLSDSVLFTTLPSGPGNWQGIIVNEFASFNYAKISNAIDGIKVNSNDFEITNSLISNNSNSGIYFNGSEQGTGGLVGTSEIHSNKTGIICEAFCSSSGGSASPEISNNFIHGNENDGIYCSASGWVPSYGAASGSATASPLINSNTIKNNGGFAISCYANGDEAESYQGTLMKRYGYANPKIINNVIYNNSSSVSSAKHDYRSNADVVLINNSFYKNGQIYAYGAKIDFVNSIIWDQEATIQTENYGSVGFDNCCIEGQNGTNIDEDPLFADPENGNFNLTETSHCIDAGLNSSVDFDTDFTGNIRIWDGDNNESYIIDIGAIEFASVSESAPIITNQSTGGIYCENSEVELSVEVIASPEPDFYWYLNDSLIAGAESSTYMIAGLDSAKTGDYTCIIKNSIDSVFSEIITIEMDPVYDITNEITICAGDSFEIGSQFFATDTTVTQYLSTFKGCDSTITTTLTVIPEYQITEDIEICGGESYKTWNESGTYFDTITSIYGCDIVVETNLTVNPAYEYTENIEICEGESFNNHTESGIYKDTLTSVHGCDSIIITNLTVNPTYEFFEDISLCDGDSYKGWSETGSYSDTVFSDKGCFIIVHTDLKVNPVYQITLDTFICEGESYLGYTETGHYVDSLKTVEGCDSIILTNLTVNPVYEIEEDVLVCEGEFYKGWNETGTYADTLSSSTGCDSIIITNLTVNPVYETEEIVSICMGESYKGWDEAGTYADTLMSSVGCDSIIITNLTVNPVYETEENVAICDGESYNGWDETGIYADTLESISGCDSIIITNLTVYSGSVTEEDISICKGGSYKGWTETGTYRDTLIYISGCENITITHLTVHPVFETEVDISADKTTVCEGDTVNFTAVPYNEGANPVYDWFVNGIEVTGEHDISYSYVPRDGDQVFVRLTSDASCVADPVAVSNTITINVADKLAVNVYIRVDKTAVCEGDAVNFTALPLNEGNNPVYDWFVNGVEVAGEHSETYSYVPLDGDQVFVRLTSDASCVVDSVAVSDSITINVTDKLTVNVDFIADKTIVCEGNVVNFTAIPQNGGGNPVYDWFVNGVEVAGEHSETYSYVPMDGDKVFVRLTSGETCVVDSVAVSDSITISVTDKLTVNVDIVADKTTICEGDVVNFTATPQNGGGSPVYDWFVNGVAVTGEHNETYSYAPLDGDQVFVRLTSGESCVIDSVAVSDTIAIDVADVLMVEVDITICEGGSHKGWTEPDTYTENLTSQSGCDSTVITHLTVNDVYEVSEDIEICAGDDYNGWTETDTYYRTLTSATGCDSIVTTHLTVHPVFETEVDVTICEGASHKGWTETDTYTENLISQSGCDSTVITHLTVNDVYEVSEDIEICAGDDYNGWTESNTYYRTLTSAAGCDSIVTTNLTVHSSYEPAIAVLGDTLKSVDSYPAYQWYNENGAIDDAINKNFVIDHSGEYHLAVIDENGCMQTSAVVNAIYSSTDIVGLNKLKYLVIPNPNRGIFTFRLDSKPEQELTLKLINPLGQLIEVRTLENTTVNHSERFDVSHLSKGMFYLIILNKSGQKVEKIVVQ